MDFSAFSHGQIQSKIWLCENIERYLGDNNRIAILGCWYNVLGLLLLSRNPNKYKTIIGIDKDPSAIEIANKICQGFMIQPNVVIQNIVQDVNTFDYNGYDIVINCSVEHIESNSWFEKIKSGTLICLQSSNVTKTDEVWDIKNPNPDLDTLVAKYPLRTTYHKKTYTITYNDWGYQRYMLIGKK